MTPPRPWSCTGALEVRRTQPDLGAGDSLELDAPEGVLAFRREGFGAHREHHRRPGADPAPGSVLLASTAVAGRGTARPSCPPTPPSGGRCDPLPVAHPGHGAGRARRPRHRRGVRPGRIAAYLNDLLSLGVDGFRVDAAKHIPVNDLKNIKSRLSNRAPTGSRRRSTGRARRSPRASTPRLGDAQEFRYGWTSSGSSTTRSSPTSRTSVRAGGTCRATRPPSSSPTTTPSATARPSATRTAPTTPSRTSSCSPCPTVRPTCTPATSSATTTRVAQRRPGERLLQRRLEVPARVARDQGAWSSSAMLRGAAMTNWWTTATTPSPSAAVPRRTW
ncbi:hypothetical protein SALBM135S_02732 [Streptomyces alboniger]